MSLPTVRLGLVGLGWGERTAAALRSLAGVELAWCHARSVAAREEFARRFGCRAAAHYEEMLADVALDGVVIMTPNGSHRALAVAALRAGKHVLVTKPVATTLMDATEMVAAARSAGRILAVAHQSRRQPAVRKLKELLASGALGQPVLLEGNTSSPTGLDLAPDTWRRSLEECPGGPLLQLGIHYVDNFQYLLGPIKTVAGWQRSTGPAGAPPDTTLTTFEFAGGQLGNLLSSYIVPSTRWIRLTGTAAVATYDAPCGLAVQPKSGAMEIVLPSAPGEEIIGGTILEEAAEFIACIRGERAPEIDGVAGLRNLAVVLAAVESQRRGGPVAVDDLLRAAGVAG